MPNSGFNIELAKIEIPFIENRGQINDDVAYYARTFGGTLFVTTGGNMLLNLPNRDREKPRQALIQEEFIGGSGAHPKGMEISPTRVSSFIGNDPSRWQRNVSTYNAVSLENLYQGINLQLRAYGGSVEKVFTIQPGTDPSSIQIGVEGIESLSITENGTLSLKTAIGEATYSAPLAYQETVNGREKIQVAYAVEGNRYGFKLGPYDRDLPLTIDPILGATYLGGSLEDRAYSLAFDNGVYVAGVTWSADFPGVDSLSAQSTRYGTTDIFLAHLDYSLGALYQATYLGGTSWDEPGTGNGGGPTLAVHPSTGDIYVTGFTQSSNFPGVDKGNDWTKSGLYDAFIAYLDPELSSLKAATYFGGSGQEIATAMAIDPSSGDVYITGRTQSTDLTGAAGGFQPTNGGGDWDGFAALFSPGFYTLRQSTYFGGSGIDWPYSIATPEDGAHPAYGSVFITGETYSTDFPATEGGYQSTNIGGTDVFVIELSSSLTAGQSTYLGGTGGDTGYSVKVHPASGKIYIGGSTSSVDFPGTSGGVQEAHSSTAFNDAFVAVLDSELANMEQSTYLGGNGAENNCGLYLEPDSGDVYVAGTTSSNDFPGTEGGIQPDNADGLNEDAFVARLTEDLTTLYQATYIGGTSKDMCVVVGSPTIQNGIYIAGLTWSVDFPGMSDTYSAQPVIGSSSNPKDAYVVRLDGTLQPEIITPDIHVSSLSLDFGTIAVGKTESLPVAIENIGTGDLTVDSIQIQSAANFSADMDSDYGSIPACNNYAVSADKYVLAAGDLCAVYVIFHPDTEISYTDTLTIQSDDPDEISIDIALAGEGGGAPIIDVSPLTINFGPITVGQASERYISISNPGSVLLTIESMELSDTENFTLFPGHTDSHLDDPPCSDFATDSGRFELQSDQHCQVGVVLEPIVHGFLQESLEIKSNAMEEPFVTVSLEGGTDFGLVPGEYHFGTLTSTDPVEARFSLTNHASTAHSVHDIYANLDTSGNIVTVVLGTGIGLCPESPFDLPGEESCDFLLRFDPDTSGSFNGRLVIDLPDFDPNIQAEFDGSVQIPPTPIPPRTGICSLSTTSEHGSFRSSILMLLFAGALLIWRRKKLS